MESSQDGGRLTTFLMGDLVGSTTNWLAAPALMEQALRFHDDLVASSVSNAGGVVFKHTGDGFLSQFDDPDGAVDAARAIRAGLPLAAPELESFLQVRMAIDTGWATSRAGDWFGPGVNRVARVTDLVTSVGVVMTQASAEVMRRTEPGDHLGEIVLRSHDVATGLVGLDGADLAEQERPSNGGRLPRPGSSFVGRVDEMTRVRKLVAEHRLVTIVATGGAGKTRLAIEAAAEEPEAGFVDLVLSHDDVEVARQVADGAGVDMDGLAPSAGLDAIRRHTASHLGDSRRLLVLDNCEHVLASARDEIDQLLDRCPRLRILATSRERLDARGEHLWLLPSMDVGAELFRQRAEAHGVELGDSPEVDAAIVDVCSRLDGLPLAIELAAARLTEIGLGQLVTDLDHLMVSDTATTADALGRRRTMREVVEWSQSTLDEPAQRLFERVALLEGTFGPPDVGLLGGTDPRFLSALVRRSLLVPERDGLDLRYRMLEPVRQVAKALLQERGEFDNAMTVFLDGLRTELSCEYGGGYWDWTTLDRLRPLLPTLWRTTEWLERRGDDRELLSFVAKFAGASMAYADAGRVVDLMADRMHLLADFPIEEQAEILVSYALAGIGSMQVVHTTAAVVGLYQLELGDHPALSFAHRSAALGAMVQAQAEGEDSPFALEMLELARDAALRSGVRYERAAVEAYHGWAHLLAGRWSDALEASDQGLSHVPAENVWHMILTTNRGMALVRLDRSDDALAIVTGHPDRGRYTYWGDTLGYVEILALAHLGRHGEADRLLRTSIERVLGSIHPGHRSDLILVGAWVAVLQDRHDDAAALIAQPVTTRGPHTLQLCRGLEELTGVAATRSTVEDTTVVEHLLTPLLEQELERLATAIARPASGS
ncbi:MAG: hypothetical protein RIB98_13370 [Acidimicrobiales bacterium]